MEKKQGSFSHLSYSCVFFLPSTVRPVIFLQKDALQHLVFSAVPFLIKEKKTLYVKSQKPARKEKPYSCFYVRRPLRQHQGRQWATCKAMKNIRMLVAFASLGL